MRPACAAPALHSSLDHKLINPPYSDFGAQITPFASRTFQYTKEQLGQAEDKVITFPLLT